MQDDYAQADAAAPTDHRIDFDLHCITCGYNLRSALASGMCPECGEPVETTLRPDLLHMASPSWLGKLHKGSNWLIAAIVMSLSFIPVAMFIGFMSVAGSLSSSGNLPAAATIVLGLLGFIIAITYAVATWLMTSPEPNIANHPITCAMARWLILTSILIGLFTSLLDTVAAQGNARYLSAALDFVSSVMLLVGYLAGLLYLRKLAERIPEPSLAKQTTTVFWGYLVTVAITLVVSLGITIYAIAVVSTPTPQNIGMGAMGAMGAMGLLMCPLGLAMLVFIIWLIVLIFRYRTRFAQAHQIARSQSQMTATSGV